jgi:hypothetical protein
MYIPDIYSKEVNKIQTLQLSLAILDVSLGICHENMFHMC